MHKIILTLCLVMAYAATSSAQVLTAAQKKAKSDLYSAIIAIGNNVEDLSDEESVSYSFTSLGRTFFASIELPDEKPLYFTLGLWIDLPSTYDVDMSREAAMRAASDAPVFVYCEEGYLLFDCEMYAYSAKPFTDVLTNMINALYTADSAFTREYAAVQREQGSSTATTKEIGKVKESAGSATAVATNDENTYIFPRVTTKGDDGHLYITKVTRTAKYTILDMTSYNKGQYAWCRIERGSYLTANGTKYTLKSAEGIAYSPEYTYYPNWLTGREARIDFKLYFPSLPAETTTFDFSEGIKDGWKINGVHLEHGNTYAIQGTEVETEYHKWHCVNIEVQEGQTIVTKVCTPKESGTYIWSSQEEYIEDADTGKKYYLQQSSIGFENSGRISTDTAPITVYEVYPALPATVKRINIWSGAQYYVTNMSLR